jgi:probable F420-dependent oxidoreductase
VNAVGLPDPAASLAVMVGNRVDADPGESLAMARLADRLGYDEVWIGESTGHDVFAAAVAVGLATDVADGAGACLALGPLPVAVRDPATVARGAASVAAITGRRVGVVLGASSTSIVEDWHGRSRGNPVKALVEHVEALRGLLAGEPVDFVGSAIRTRGFRCVLPPSAAGVTALGFGTDTLREIMGRVDRIAVPLASVEHAARLAARLRLVGERMERPAPRLAVWVPTVVDPDAAGEEQLRRLLLPYLRAAGFGHMFTEAGFGEIVALARTGAHPRSLLSEMPDDLVASVAAVGSVERARAALDEYRAVGVDELVLLPVTAGDPDAERTLTALAGR